MSMLARVNCPVSAILSAAIAFSPACASAFVVVYDIEIRVQELGHKKTIQKIFEPIARLTKTAGAKQMMREAANFLRAANTLAGSKISLDQTMTKMVTCLREKGIHFTDRQIIAIRDAIALESCSLDADDTYEELGPIDPRAYEKIDMPDEAILGCVWVFCGALCAMLPIPGAGWFGLGLVINGCDKIISANAEENKKRNGK